jgi:hypothetical protein
MITLVIGCGITIHYKSINLTSIYNHYKISNKSLPWPSKTKPLIASNNGNKQNMMKMTKTLHNVPW